MSLIDADVAPVDDPRPLRASEISSSSDTRRLETERLVRDDIRAASARALCPVARIDGLVDVEPDVGQGRPKFVRGPGQNSCLERSAMLAGHVPMVITADPPRAHGGDGKAAGSRRCRPIRRAHQIDAVAGAGHGRS